MGSGSVVIVTLFILIFAFVEMVWVLNRIINAGPHEVLVISGRRRRIRLQDGKFAEVGFRMLKGGRTFIWPFIERVDRLSLEPMPIQLRYEDIAIKDNSKIKFEGSAIVRIPNEDEWIVYAGSSLLSKSSDEIAMLAKQKIESVLRLMLKSMTFDEINSSWEKIYEYVRQETYEDLKGFGLKLLDFGIRIISTYPQETASVSS